MEKVKNKRLKLDELKVQSFVTELRPETAHTAKGGDEDGTVNTICTAISPVINSIFGNSGASKWPCRFLCPTTPPPGGGGGGGTGGGGGGNSEMPPIAVIG